MDFGDYAQVNELPSVMPYDHGYMRKQSTKRRKLGEDDMHLANFHPVRQRDALRSRPPINHATHTRPPRISTILAPKYAVASMEMAAIVLLVYIPMSALREWPLYEKGPFSQTPS